MNISSKDYYYILGIEAGATLQQIKVSYHKLSMKFHPDKNDGDKFFSEHFMEIQEAYEVLSNPNKRQAYDTALNGQRYEQQDIRERQESIRRKEEELQHRENELRQKEASKANSQTPNNASSHTFKSSIAEEIRRDGRFIAYDNGTVLDTRTNLMWAAKDNGSYINWPNAKSYCENYCGGGYKDWRMPILNELKGLYDETKFSKLSGFVGFFYFAHLTELFRLTSVAQWASEYATRFGFQEGSELWLPESLSPSSRVLPVRSGK